jgi:serine protease AprX
MIRQRLLIVLVLQGLLLTASPATSRSIPIEIPDEFSRSKSAKVLSDRAVSYLETKAVDGNVKIWVFFTDRGVKTPQEFSQAATTLYDGLTERTLARRAKVGKDKLTITDVPVKAEYVDAIVELGATLRRTSRYLNAASFEVPLVRLNEISSQPFVAEIRPMLGNKKEYGVTPKDQDKSGSLDGTELDYGDSYAQLAQINVIAAHNAGYSGAGVLVAMFDTGFRTTHTVFSNIVTTGRLIAEHDFVFDDGDVDNEPEDDLSAWSHGTYTWSTLGGEWAGFHYGPAYGADFVLAKTEDIRSETPVEEDNWVAAVEWADSIGAQVISSSLTYTEWYTYSDFDGNTATVTIAADIAASLGIVVCNSAGNAGPGAGTIGAPSDADSVLAVGAVYDSGGIVGFSSHGPTYDGRIKPEICARGYATACASASSDSNLTAVSGTSLSCPLIGGVAALVIEAHPDWTPMQVREAIMMTGDNAATPNNTYGWGIANCLNAINYGSEPEYVHGDADESGFVDIDDVTYLIAYIFSEGAAPTPVEAAGDANGSGEIDIDDALYLIAYIFSGGPNPV